MTKKFCDRCGKDMTDKSCSIRVPEKGKDEVYGYHYDDVELCKACFQCVIALLQPVSPKL